MCQTEAFINIIVLYIYIYRVVNIKTLYVSKWCDLPVIYFNFSCVQLVGLLVKVEQFLALINRLYVIVLMTVMTVVKNLYHMPGVVLVCWQPVPAQPIVSNM